LWRFGGGGTERFHFAHGVEIIETFIAMGVFVEGDCRGGIGMAFEVAGDVAGDAAEVGLAAGWAGFEVGHDGRYGVGSAGFLGGVGGGGGAGVGREGEDGSAGAGGFFGAALEVFDEGVEVAVVLREQLLADAVDFVDDRIVDNGATSGSSRGVQMSGAV
jgi:hypothetical protein